MQFIKYSDLETVYDDMYDKGQSLEIDFISKMNVSDKEQFRAFLRFKSSDLRKVIFESEKAILINDRLETEINDNRSSDYEHRMIVSEKEHEEFYRNDCKEHGFQYVTNCDVCWRIYKLSR
jgi:hypothetical protein